VGGTSYYLNLNAELGPVELVLVGASSGPQKNAPRQSRRIPLIEKLTPRRNKVFYGERRARTPMARFDLGTEVRVAYALDGGKTTTYLTLVMDDRELPGLSCQARGYATPVVSPDTRKSAAERYARPLNEYADERGADGHLIPFAILAVDASLRRLSLAPDRAKVEEAFAPAIANSLKRIDDQSLRVIRARLSQADKALLDSLVQRTGYREYPEVKRLADWAVSATQDLGPDGKPGMNVMALRGVLHQFVGSPAFADKALKDYFVKEVSPHMKSFDPKGIEKIGKSFPKTEQRLLRELAGLPESSEDAQ
jgi:hypothetical protein